MPTTRKPRTTLAPISVRMRSRRMGRIGFSIRDSHAANAASRIAAAPPKPSVCAGGPAVVGGGDDRVDGDHHRGRDQDRAGDVDPAPEAEAGAVLDQPRAEREHGRRRSAGSRRRSSASRRTATSAPPSSSPSEPPEVTTNMYAPIAFTRSSGRGKSVTMRAMITEVAIAPPRPWRKRAAISSELAVGDAAERGGDGEEGDAGEEDPLATDQVAKPSGHQEKAPVGDEVGADHPCEVGLREAQIALDHGQGHIDDRHVDDHHQLTEAYHDQRHPLAP